jgi:hypothetical protein
VTTTETETTTVVRLLSTAIDQQLPKSSALPSGRPLVCLNERHDPLGSLVVAGRWIRLGPNVEPFRSRSSSVLSLSAYLRRLSWSNPPTMNLQPALQSQRIASTDGLDLLAEQIAGLALNRIFSHQLELRIRLLLPNRNFGKRNGDRAIAERILPRLLHAIYVVPGYVHKCLSGRTSFSSRRAAEMGVIDVRY